MADRTSVSSTFHIDTSEIRRKIYYKYGRPAVDILVSEMRTSFQDSGKIARHEANVLIKGGESSRLAKASKVTVRERARSIEAVVDWNDAVSDEGFHYAAAVDKGRKAFGPKTAKVLRFEIGNEVVFAMHVKAAPAQDFTGRGLRNARPLIINRMQVMKTHVHRRLAAA